MEYLILLGVLCSLFYRSLFCGYSVDDTARYMSMKDMKKQRREMGFFNFFWYALYGAGVFKNAKQEYIFTTSLHYINCCLIFSVTGSLMVAVLYMLNPVNNQVAVWLNGRRYAIGILCCLLAWKFKIGFLLFYAFAIWLHVYAIALPVMMLFTDLWPLVPLAIIILILVGWKRLKSRHDSRKKDFFKGNELQTIRPQKIIVYIKSLGFYFFHTVLPNKPRMYHEFLYYFSRYPSSIKEGYKLNFEFFKGLLVCIFLGYEIGFQHNLWAVWWLVFISQWCNIYTVTQNAADRYCSLAGIGLMVILVKYIELVPLPYKYAVYSAFITFYILRYLPLFSAFLSIDNFHRYHMNIEPGAVESRSLQATRCLKRNDPFSAFAIVKEGLRYRQKDFKLLIVMSQVLFAMQKYEQAHQVLDIAQKHVPLGDEEDCKKEFDKIRKDPRLGVPKPIVPNRKSRRDRK